MKALTDKIIEALESKAKGFIGSLKDNETMAESKGFRDGLLWAIGSIQTLESQAEFEEIARVMMKHLKERNDLYHPHMTVIIDCTNAELLEGNKSTGKVMDYVKD